MLRTLRYPQVGLSFPYLLGGENDCSPMSKGKEYDCRGRDGDHKQSQNTKEAWKLSEELLGGGVHG